MPQYMCDEIVLIADEDEAILEGTPAILKEIFDGEALVLINGKENQMQTVPLDRVEPFYRSEMKFAH